jgi:hypothetical protein
MFYLYFVSVLILAVLGSWMACVIAICEREAMQFMCERQTKWSGDQDAPGVPASYSAAIPSDDSHPYAEPDAPPRPR